MTFRRLKAVIIAAALALPACVTTTNPAPRDSHFEIVSDQWMALHLFAYHAARAQSRDKLRGRVPLDAADRALFTDEVRAAFGPLAEAYAPYIRTSLLHDADTQAIAKALRAGPDAIRDAKLRAALTEFMPVYERVFWPRHKARNEALIAALTPQLVRFESDMAARLSAYLERPWPDDPIRVDIAPYANWAGAYTADQPAHIIMSAQDKEMIAHAFEMMFHEASHTHPLGENIDLSAEAALAEFNIQSRGFWHFLLFYTSGRAAAETLGDPDYIPYAYDVGLAERAHAKPFYDALDAVWDDEDTLAARARAAIALVAEDRAETGAR